MTTQQPTPTDAIELSVFGFFEECQGLLIWISVMLSCSHQDIVRPGHPQSGQSHLVCNGYDERVFCFFPALDPKPKIDYQLNI